MLEYSNKQIKGKDLSDEYIFNVHKCTTVVTTTVTKQPVPFIFHHTIRHTHTYYKYFQVTMVFF